MTQLCWPNGSTAAEPRRTDNYGPRDPIWTSGGWTRPYHVGTDWASIGRICSIGNGVVISTEYIGWAGWQVLIDLGVIGGERTWVRDCHLAEQSPLRVGDRVSMGQFIGTEGATGQVTGRHLHKEIYRGSVDRGSGSNPGSTIDPAKFIAAHLASDLISEAHDMKLFWTTDGTGWLATEDAVHGLASPQVYNLFYRVINSNQALTPFAGQMRAFVQGATDGKPDTFLAAEVAIMNATLKLVKAANSVQATIDTAKLADALSAELGKKFDPVAEIEIDPAQLAKALDAVVPRITAALIKQAGEKLAKQ